MMTMGNLKMALASLRSSRWRSMLTMLGVIVGVVSVVTTVSLGEGVKRQIEGQIKQQGEDIITILPGKHVERDERGQVVNISPFFGQNNVLFTEGDYRTVSGVPGAETVVPFSQVIGKVESGTGSFPEAQVIASTAGAPVVLNQRLQFGGFYRDDDPLETGAVIGRRVAERLFQEKAPIGKAFTFRGQEFRVHGVFEEFVNRSPFMPGGDYNSAIFISHRKGQEMMGGNLQIYQILVRPAEGRQSVDQVIGAITKAMSEHRGYQQDFTVLRQDENLAMVGSVVHLLTSFVASIAAISLIVGGIGIMNIMLVSVSERVSEIGIRKAVGATNRQILSQFLTEAAILSLLGGIFGVLLSFLVNFVLRIFTDLQPIITLPVVLAAIGVALTAGIVFGMTPAMKAARMDPIDALRHE